MKKILIVIFIICSSIRTFAVSYSVTRCEPSFWWVGMKNPDVQLLVYGSSISDTKPSVAYPGVTITNVTSTTNPNYLFITLQVASNTVPGKFLISFSKDKKVVTKFEYQLFERVSGSAQRKSYDASDVVYLIMPDRFSNGDTANDSHSAVFEKANRADPNGRHGGDIQGIINRLDYLKDLGFTAIWNTPVQEDNMDRYSYHTYAITDYYKIDPRYGSNADYKRLGTELHNRGMKLIMDVVTNHCGLNYFWMKDLPSKDWVHQFPQFTRSNYQISTTYDPYASEYDKNLNYNGWFDTSMPDLNQDNPLLLTFLIQNTIWWIEYAGLDGIRIDTYPYNNPWKVADWSRSVRAEYPNMNIVGECWVHTSQELAYWQTGVQNFDGYDSGLPAVMDFTMHDAYLTAFTEEDNWNGGMRRFYNHFTQDYVFPNPNNLMIFTENHDTPRFNELINGDMQKFKMAYTILFTTRGIPQFYYGSEIMMRGEKNKGDGDIRKDFPGGWLNDSQNAFVKEGRTSEQTESYEFIKKLLNWRKANPVIATGKMLQFIPQDNWYVYFRYNVEKTVMVVVNNNPQTRKLDTSRFNEVLKGFTSGYEVLSGVTVSNLATIEVPSKSAMVIELKK